MTRPLPSTVIPWLLALCITTPPAAALAQAATTAPASPPVATEGAAFTLDIDAPPEVRELLLRHLDLVRYRELGDLSDSELDRLLDVARQDALNLLATLGYFSPQLQWQRLPRDGATPPRVRLRVSIGPATLVSEVRISLSGPVSQSGEAKARQLAIERGWTLAVGQRFTQAGWDAAKQQALRELTTQRFPQGQISESLADIDPARGQATLSLTLDSGPAYRLGEQRIEGLRQHDADMVRRLARLAPGSDYDFTQLSQAQQRLADSGYFDSVYVFLEPNADPTAAPVRIQLREAPLQKIVLGLGASTDGGGRVSAEHTHHRVPGLGWRSVSKLSLDRETQSLGLELTAPPDESNWRWAVGALVQEQQAGSNDVTSQRLRAGRSQAAERIDRNYYLQYDRADTLESDTTAPQLAQALSANYAFTVRNFDTLPSPGNGWALGLEIGAGTTLGKERQPFGRGLAKALAFFPFGSEKQARRYGRLALRAEAGAVVADASASVPSTQLFLTGGDNSVRGYSFHGIGVTRSDGQTVAGRYLAAGSLEWQRPLALGRPGEWEGTVFLDAGAVADTPADLRAKVGVGTGLRWKSPVGPLQLDLAYGAALRQWRLHLNVGFNF